MSKNSDLLLDISILYRSTQKYYDQMLQSMSLTYAQLPILILIYENEGISLQRIAEEGSYDKGTITKQVQKLEDNGYIRVQPSQRDKRAKELYTTRKARQSMSRVYAIRTSWWRHISASIPKEKMEAFTDFYKSMAASAREVASTDLSAMAFFEHQKISIQSVPQKMSTILATGGCNYRCPFCNKANLVFLKEDAASIPESDILPFLEKRKNALQVVTISGGEPLMHPELDKFLMKVKKMGYQIHIETNGSYPEHLETLIQNQLADYITMHIKNSKEKYGETIGLPDYEPGDVDRSIQLLNDSDVDTTYVFTPIRELHTLEDLISMAQWIQNRKKCVLHPFKETATVIQQGLHGFEIHELEEIKTALQSYLSRIEIR